MSESALAAPRVTDYDYCDRHALVGANASAVFTYWDDGDLRMVPLYFCGNCFRKNQIAIELQALAINDEAWKVTL